ncbi:hypothetical protein, partial [Brachyspira sp.]|uniref:hypothetical protein n=1 Tax=Brachyspira sp. TaxID=1977261 RepID=UPI0026316511
NYYSKVFKNSDIYDVYINAEKVINDNTFIKEIKMDYKGSPFGSLISTKKIDDEKIDNIVYTLKVKSKIIMILILISFILLIFKYLKIKLPSCENANKIFNAYLFIFCLFTLSIPILSILGNIERVSSIKDLTLYKSDNTNYIYNFKIHSNRLFFNSNKIYKFKHYLANEPDYISKIEITNSFDGIGILTSSKPIEDNEIDNLSYLLDLRKEIFYIYAISIYLLALLYIMKKNSNKTLNENILYNVLIPLIGFSLFFFNYWLCFPGLRDGDTIYIIKASISKVFDNWHPAFIQLLLHILYNLFGYSIHYMFTIIMSFWYIGITLIIISLYNKYQNKYILLLFFISFIDDVFFMNMWKLKDTFALSFLWLSISLLFFIILTPFKNNKINVLIKIISVFLLTISMLFRHNFIVTIYPIYIIFVYDILKNKNIKDYKIHLLKFASIMLIIAFTLVSIYKLYPKLPFVIDNSREVAAYVLHSFIAARIAVLENDDSMIPKKWYNENKNFNDVIEDYKIYPYASSSVLVREIFAFDRLHNSKEIATKYIKKYPFTYIKFSLSMMIKMWKLSLNNSTVIHYKINFDNFYDYFEGHNPYFESQVFYNYSEDFYNYNLRKIIYNIFYKISIHINIIFFISISILIFLIDIFIIIRNIKKISKLNNMLIVSFATSFSTFASAFIIGTVAVLLEYRYIYIVLPLSILSIISFIIFVYDLNKTKSLEV